MEFIKKRIGKYDMYLDAEMRGISGDLNACGVREPEFMWIIKKEATGKTGLDLGANIGYTTLPICEKMHKVIAVEPDKRSRSLLIKNLALNKFNHKTRVLEYAISDFDGEKVFYLNRKPNLNTLGSARDGSYKTKKVPCITLDTLFLDELNKLPNFIKMDVEGHEVEILRGGMKCLAKTDTCGILIEVHPERYSTEHNFAEILEKYISLGYYFKYVVSAGHDIPEQFTLAGYSPIKTFKFRGFNRRVFQDIKTEDAIKFCSARYMRLSNDGNQEMNKIVRSIFLKKKVSRRSV